MTDRLEFFDGLAFRHEWRKYQRIVLDLFEQRDPSKRTFHVVSPPGSGKTLVGIEIARRIGRPAVTFSPTTTIQDQWREKVRLFLPEDGAAGLLDQVSTDPRRLGAISSLTYQSLSTQTQEREFLDRLGRAAWLMELVEEGGRSPEGAAEYLQSIRARSEKVHARGVALRATREKRRVLASGEADVHALLHPNAIDLIERLVAAGTGCVILDEAHHLLDYWAMILADLIRQLPDALVVGLTATPPASSDPEEMGNYLRLVNGIDFEVPTPAVVRSGFLAPYQDLALVTRPTSRELVFLEQQEETLRDAVAEVIGDPRFTAALTERINRPSGTPAWEQLMIEEFEFAVAGVRFLASTAQPIAEDIELLAGLRAQPTVDDSLALVRWWCLDHLRLSDDPADATRLADLRAILRTLGMVMTDTGWRKAASPLDRVLAYSDSKVAGMVEILALEHASLGDRLRAVVLTDYERAGRIATRSLQGVLDPESGGAVRAFRALRADNATQALDPIMVTGRTVLLDSDLTAVFLERAAAFFDDRSLAPEISASEIEPGVALVEGSGGDWRPRNYVALITAMFEEGVTRCLVGTRGLLAEGWDSLKLNTLVDLTTAGTYASVNQIRGRSIRLDPDDPLKVANNWDVVCYEPGLKRGDVDLNRLIGKHLHTWGLGNGGRIVKGIGHVDDRLLLLSQEVDDPFRTANPSAINQLARVRARNRDRAYERWGIGKPYDNFEFEGTILEWPEWPMQTAFTLGKSLRALLNTALAMLVAYLILFTANLWQAALALPMPWAILVMAALVIGPAGLAAPLFWRYARAAFIELPVDSYLADFGRAIAEAFRATGLQPMLTDQVLVRESEDGTYDVVLDSRDKAAVKAFAEAFQELFEPVIDQRYLVTRDETSISPGFYSPLWWIVRGVFRTFRRGGPVYHPVPTAFSRRKELATAFGAAWRRWVGGGELIYTRAGPGVEILLRERVSRRALARTARVEEWR